MKCVNCKHNKTCKEKLVFSIKKITEWHKNIYKKPHATSIQHLLTSEFSTLLEDYPCSKQINAICHITISLLLAEISHMLYTDKTTAIAYSFMNNTDDTSNFIVFTVDDDDAAIKIVNIVDINLPSNTKLIVDIKLCFYSHLIPQIETILRYPLYTINYQFSLPPVHQVSHVIFHNMEN